MAKDLENDMVSKWKTLKLTPQAVLQLLKLDDSTDKLSSPVLQIAVHYIDWYNGDYWNNRDRQFSLLGMFTKKFGDGDVALALMKALNSDSPSYNAGRLERELKEKWQHNGKTAKDMIELLNIGKDGHYVLGSLRVQVLTKYLREERETVPAIFEILRRAYGDDIDFALTLSGTNGEDGYHLRQELFNYWRGREVEVVNDILKTAIERDAERGRELEKSYHDFEEEKEMEADHLKSYGRFEDDEHDVIDLHHYEHLPLSPRRK